MCHMDKTGYCSTHVVGLAPLYKMCDPRHSCVVIEDRGLSSSFILAHEMGHRYVRYQHSVCTRVCMHVGMHVQWNLYYRLPPHEDHLF